MQSVADAGMASEASPSTSTVVDSEASTTNNTCRQLPTAESQLRLQSNSSETVNYDAGSDNELKPGWEVSAREGDRPALKKPKLEVASSNSTEGESGSELKPGWEVSAHEDDRPALKEPKLEVASSNSTMGDSGSMTEPKLETETSCSNENVTESVTNERLQSGIDEDSGGAAKKPRLDKELIRSTEEESSERSDRRRNKSTSAAVLLGLVKSRVRKLAADRLESKSVSSDATTSSSSQTSASSLSAKASPKVSTPPSEYLSSVVLTTVYFQNQSVRQYVSFPHKLSAVSVMLCYCHHIWSGRCLCLSFLQTKNLFCFKSGSAVSLHVITLTCLQI